MRLFQAALDTRLDNPFSATLSVHGLHFTVCAPSILVGVWNGWGYGLVTAPAQQKKSVNFSPACPCEFGCEFCCGFRDEFFFMI